jgi:hypothetical protein|tara:strand:- start:75 stop:548 length:474 start_codon:yes stop_codon:yes gene_type:complete
MPGRPARKILLKKMTDLGGTDFLIEHIGGGGTMKALAVIVGYSPSFTSRIINGTPEYRAALHEARHIQADLMAEDSMGILDDLTDKPELSSQDVQLAKERVNVRKWLTALNNPDRFAQKKDEIVVNIGELHLGALKKISREMLNVTPVAAEIEHDED